MDIDSIAAGADFIYELERSIRNSDVLIALIGRQWAAPDASGRRRLEDPADHVRAELEAALAHDIRIIPTLVSGAALPVAADLPPSLQPLVRRQAIELGDTTFGRDVDRLVQEIHKIRASIQEERREQAAHLKRERKEEEIRRKKAAQEALRSAADRKAASSPVSKWLAAPVRFWALLIVRFPLLGRPLWATALAATLFAIVALGLFTYFYAKYARIVDLKLREGPIPKATTIYAAPEPVRLGDRTSAEEIAAALRRAGYTDSAGAPEGFYKLHRDSAAGDSIEIYPGPKSFFDQEPAYVKFSGGEVALITHLDQNNTPSPQYLLEAPYVTNVASEKRRLTTYSEIPAVMVQALISAEDKRFFQHAGIDPLRLLEGFWRRRVDAATPDYTGPAPPRASLTLQLARMLWTAQEPRSRWRDLMIALILEHRLSKQEILEFYANQVYMGGTGKFIRGFGEASASFFGKPLGLVTLPEAAMLAGIVCCAERLDPYRHPDWVKARRDYVLSLMRENSFVSDREYQLAVEAPLTLARRQSDDAPHFADMVSDELKAKSGDVDLLHGANRVYTTLDLRLQRTAVNAIRDGIREIAENMGRNPRWSGYPEPDTALIALDPTTGEVKALIGGRDYDGKVNRILEKRQPGAVFLPFDYAAAASAIPASFTLLTQMNDMPRQFSWNGRSFVAPQYQSEHRGVVTLREALARSLYVPAIEAAERVGYAPVADLARKCGIEIGAEPSPAVAMGLEPVTPLELAEAYTVFANNGAAVRPILVDSIRIESGKTVYRSKQEWQPVLSPSVSFLIREALEESARTGAAKAVQSIGLTPPVAVITGFSRDAWCVGFTRKLLTLVWIGYDDRREFPLDGADSALQIWSRFMASASRLADYTNHSLGPTSSAGRDVKR
jgi:penicillin-binding protein 1B